MEVVGSTPTPSTFINLVKYGIRISTFFDLGHLRLMMELFYPLLLSWNVSKMGMLNNRNRKMPLLSSIHLVATIFTLTIIFASTTTLVSASITGNTTTTTTTPSVGGEEQEAVSSSTTTTNNNVSNAVLGDVFMIVEFETASVNPINETYIEISTVHNVTLMPPNATTGMTINATETANTTVNILPNGLALDKGQSLIVAEGDDDDGTAEQENATTTFVDLSRMNPDGTGSGTGVVFFSTNSTGQLAFLDNMVGINDSEFSQGGGTIRVWEWKGGTLPLETDSPPTTGNQTIITSAPEEEE
jgi:hypothetical protein